MNKDNDAPALDVLRRILKATPHSMCHDAEAWAQAETLCGHGSIAPAVPAGPCDERFRIVNVELLRAASLWIKRAGGRVDEIEEAIAALPAGGEGDAKDAARYRTIRHYLSPKLAAEILMMAPLPPQKGWSTEDWTDAHVDAAEP